MTNPGYAAYLASGGWKKRRRAALKRVGGVCEKCRRNTATQVHHLSYANLGDERPDDLQAICAPCHHREHPDKWDMEPRPIYAEYECEQCPSTSGDLYLDGPWKMYVCHGCGDSQKVERDASPKNPQSPQVPCPSCAGRFRSHVGLHRHMTHEHPEAVIPAKTQRKYERKMARAG